MHDHLKLAASFLAGLSFGAVLTFAYFEMRGAPSAAQPPLVESPVPVPAVPLLPAAVPVVHADSIAQKRTAFDAAQGIIRRRLRGSDVWFSPYVDGSVVATEDGGFLVDFHLKPADSVDLPVKLSNRVLVKEVNGRWLLLRMWNDGEEVEGAASI